MKRGLSDRIFEALIMLPSWFCLASGVIAYIGIEWFERTHIASANNALLTVSTSIYAPLALTGFLMAALLGAMHRAKRSNTLEQQTGLDSLRRIPWKDFEHLVAEVYERQGFAVGYSLETGPDGGIDITLRKDERLSIVQCKCWKTWSVGVSVVREMFGLLHHEQADEAIIVTTGGFTEEAQNFAKGKAIKLINGHDLWNLVSEVKTSASQEPTAPGPEIPAAPNCPKCGGEMHVKLAKNGPTAGQRFWGCRQYPDCKATYSIP